MAKKRNLLRSRVFNTPLLISPQDQSLEIIVSFLSDTKNLVNYKNQQNLFYDDTDDTEERFDSKPLSRSSFSDDKSYDAYIEDFEKRENGINPDTNTAYINIEGTLVNKAGQTQSCVELVSYEALLTTFEKQVSLGIDRVVLNFDSGGGEAYRCFASANRFKEIAKENNVEIIAYVDGFSASASYAWTSIADEVILNPMAQVGSIGVLIQLYNDSKYLENLGLERTFVFAGENKIPFNKEGNFTEAFIADLQKSVDETYDMFVSHVSENRSLNAKVVKDTEAKVFNADEAISLGLADKKMEIEDFQSYITQKSQTKGNQEDMSTKELNVATLQTANASLQAQIEQLNTEKETLTAEKGNVSNQLATALSEVTKLKADLVELQKSAVETARKEKLESVFGKDSEQATTYLQSLSTLDQSAFDMVVSGLSATKEQTAKEMTEKGHEQKAEKQPQEGSSLFSQKVKARGAK